MSGQFGPHEVRIATELAVWQARCRRKDDRSLADRPGILCAQESRPGGLQWKARPCWRRPACARGSAAPTHPSGAETVEPSTRPGCNRPAGGASSDRRAGGPAHRPDRPPRCAADRAATRRMDRQSQPPWRSWRHRAGTARPGQPAQAMQQRQMQQIGATALPRRQRTVRARWHPDRQRATRDQRRLANDPDGEMQATSPLGIRPIRVVSNLSCRLWR